MDDPNYSNRLHADVKTEPVDVSLDGSYGTSSVAVDEKSGENQILGIKQEEEKHNEKVEDVSSSHAPPVRWCVDPMKNEEEEEAECDDEPEDTNLSNPNNNNLEEQYESFDTSVPSNAESEPEYSASENEIEEEEYQPATKKKKASQLKVKLTSVSKKSSKVPKLNSKNPKSGAESVVTASNMDSNASNLSVGNYACEYCCKLFDDSDVLLHHQAKCPDRTKCKFCGKESKSTKDLKRHIRTHTGEKPYECKECGKCYSESSSFAKHKKIHTKPYQCSQCEEKFASDLYLKRHIAKLHAWMLPEDVRKKVARPRARKDNSIHICDICGQSMVRRSIKYHQLKFHSGNNAGFRCEECGASFPLLCRLKRHALTHSTKKAFYCETCGQGFNAKKTLDIHIQRDHSGTKFYRCEICDQKFTEKLDLTKHKWSHSSDDMLFKCTICHKGFTSMKNLRRHQIGHEKRFACDVCNESFSHKISLQQHRFKHTGEKPFQCEFCTKGFTTRNCLKNHIRTHTGEKPYKCEACGHQFTVLHALRTHLEKNCRGKAPDEVNKAKESNLSVPIANMNTTDPSMNSKPQKECMNDPQPKEYEHHPESTDYVDNLLPLEYGNQCIMDKNISQTSLMDKNVCKTNQLDNPSFEPTNQGEATYALSDDDKNITENVGSLSRLESVTHFSPNITSNLKNKPSTEQVKQELQVTLQPTRHHTDVLSDNICTNPETQTLQRKDATVSVESSQANPSETDSDTDEYLPVSINEEEYHAQSVPSDSNAACKHCGTEINIKLVLHDHELKCPERNRCKICGKDCKRTKDLKLHVRLHTGEKPYECEQCEKRFRDPSSFAKHRRIHSKPFKCPNCDMGFALEIHFKQHVSKYHGKITQDELQFWINEGKKNFPSVMKASLKIAKSAAETKAPKKKVERPTVPEKLVDSSPKVPTPCACCSEILESSEALKIHMPVCLYRTRCKLCGKEFTKNRDLRRHITTHTGEKPFQCAECGKRYRESSSFAKHRRTHTKPSQCTFCFKRFSLESALKHHLAKHHNTT